MKRSVRMRHPAKGTVEVPMGFSWPALLLGPLWAIVKRLWLVFLLLVLALVPIAFVDLYSEANRNIALTVVALVLYIVYMYVCGRYGNDWWRWTLTRRGFVRVEEPHEP
jgi:uncharacterized protein DUF2628